MHLACPNRCTRPQLLSPAQKSRTSVSASKGFGLPNLARDPEADLVVPPPPDLKGKAPRVSWNAVALAYLGDSVWELYARRHFFFPPSRLTTYYENVIGHVRAENQGLHYQTLRATDFLTEQEQSVLRWGRNANVKVPKRFHQSGLHGQTYKEATAIECLVGYLYLTDQDRLQEVMTYMGLSGSREEDAQ
ncbi:hypothetical protein WJX73_002089 [Symbiochloris irregularis]|uniref:RNase III domain-containing protein n=1 Tax=Symbiochloris irregularis TaxID=706552 RepID=A0AAW1PYL7_9CHLO